MLSNRRSKAPFKQLGATVTRWFAGQEHATAGWEREQRDRMLAEAEQDRRALRRGDRGGWGSLEQG